MNQALIGRTAGELDQLLRRYASSDAAARALLSAIETLLDDARAGHVVAPMEWGDVPGDHAFFEGGLGRFPDLESAYASFKIEITGGETPALRALRDARR